MRNKFYMVWTSENNDDGVNIVIASNAKKAKVLGSYTDATETIDEWVNLRVKAIRQGLRFWQGDEDVGTRVDFAVIGDGFLYTDKKSQVDHLWNNFIEELTRQGRYNQTTLIDDKRSNDEN